MIRKYAESVFGVVLGETFLIFLVVVEVVKLEIVLASTG